MTDPITGVGKDDFYDVDYAGFVEDSWKVRPNLTLNLGVRYDIQTIPQPPKPNTTTSLNTEFTSKINTDSNNFAPRIGLAYEPFKGTVVRAGYGMFYAKTTNSTWYAVRVENGVYQQTFNCSPSSFVGQLLPVADVSQRDLHPSGRGSDGAFRRRSHTAGNAVCAALSHPAQPWRHSGLRQSADPRR